MATFHGLIKANALLQETTVSIFHIKVNTHLSPVFAQHFPIISVSSPLPPCLMEPHFLPLHPHSAVSG